jgi:hypothetical protein
MPNCASSKLYEFQMMSMTSWVDAEQDQKRSKRRKLRLNSLPKLIRRTPPDVEGSWCMSRSRRRSCRCAQVAPGAVLKNNVVGRHWYAKYRLPMESSRLKFRRGASFGSLYHLLLATSFPSTRWVFFFAHQKPETLLWFFFSLPNNGRENKKMS